MKAFIVYLSDQRKVTNAYYIKAENLEAATKLSALDIIASADFIKWVGDSEEDYVPQESDYTIDDIEEVQ